MIVYVYNIENVRHNTHAYIHTYMYVYFCEFTTLALLKMFVTNVYPKTYV